VAAEKSQIVRPDLTLSHVSQKNVSNLGPIRPSVTSRVTQTQRYSSSDLLPVFNRYASFSGAEQTSY